MAGSVKKKEKFKESDFTEEEKHKVKQYIIHQILREVIYHFKQNAEWIFLRDIEIPLYEAYINLCWDELSEGTRKELLYDLETKKRRAISLKLKQGNISYLLVIIINAYIL